MASLSDFLNFPVSLGSTAVFPFSFSIPLLSEECIAFSDNSASSFRKFLADPSFRGVFFNIFNSFRKNSEYLCSSLSPYSAGLSFQPKIGARNRPLAPAVKPAEFSRRTAERAPPKATEWAKKAPGRPGKNCFFF